MSGGNQSVSTKKMYEFYLNKYKDIDIYKPQKTLEMLVNTRTKSNKKLSVSCVKVILSAFVWRLKQEKPLRKKVLVKYQEYIKELKKMSMEDEQNHNRIVGKIPKWSDIEKIRDHELDLKHWKNHLILSLYTYIPPRRLKDYVMLKIADNAKEMNDMNYNYYDMVKKQLIFNVYKTQKTHHTQIEDVPDELAEVIDGYIDRNKLKSGDLLLGFKDYHQIHYILNKLLECGVDNIRHSFVMNEYDTPEVRKLEENAEKMGHTLETHLLYHKNADSQ